MPWGDVSPCYTALGTREINEIGLSKAPGLILSLTITRRVLVSAPCSAMTMEEVKNANAKKPQDG